MVRVFFILAILSTRTLGMTLNVGEIRSWKFHSEASLNISRKGVIDIEFSNGTWKIFGLKKGVVTITPTLDGKILPKILVKVQDEEKIGKKKWGKWTDLLCQQKGVTCNFQSGVIRGVTSSWLWFFHSRHHCLKKQPCLFDVRLSHQAMDEAEKYFSNFFTLVKVSDDGRILISGHCTSKLKLPSLGKTIDPYVIKICSIGLESYVFSGHLYWLSSEEAEQLGIDPWGILGRNLLEFDSHKLYSFLNNNRTRIIAKPELKLSVGKKGFVHQGFDIIYPQENSKPHVLKGGATVNVYPKEIVNGRMLLSISIDLRLPTAEGRSFQSANFSSEIWLPLNRDVILGHLTVDSKKSTRESIPILENIPIISPIFSNKSGSRGQGQIFVNVRVDKFDYYEKG